MAKMEKNVCINTAFMGGISLNFYWVTIVFCDAL